ncbi:MAG: copper-translocating P-type ATPase [Geobacteraceae bacterium GWC2_58_44]|nr:MAG: copper-translocating P-type ATPase [Geobacteraceae bacterium GWC2_58_44]HBG06404.1 copper-translocating P-type ATPase [Geobacter sp.]
MHATAPPSPLTLSLTARETEKDSCFHCGVEIPAGVLIQESGSAGTLSFCCRGCQGAYMLICEAGLADFYRRRNWSEPGVPADAFQGSYHDGYLSRFIYPCNETSAIDIIIDGIHCASCVWLNEKILGRLDGVQDVRVNYATGRARVVFDPHAVSPAVIFSRIAEIGYGPRPYTRSAAREGARLEQRDLLYRFGTAIFLTMQLMAYSFALYAGYFQGIDSRIKGYLQIFSLLVTTPVVFYSGWPFLTGAWRGIVNRTPNMELLIAIGALSSYSYSAYATLAGGEVYFETAAMIVTLILAGRLLENSARRKAAGGVERLLGLCAGQAHRFRGDALETVDPAELRAGELILVGPGERFPVDGRIIEGSTDVDESPATGEALPVFKNTGDRVIAGSSNLTGAVRVFCIREAAESFIARVARLVEEAQSRRAPIQGLADRVSAYFVPAVLFLAMVTFCWQNLAGAPFGDSLMSALAVVVIACPCALGLATPTAILAGTGAAALGGVIFKGGDILERLSRVNLAVFDKTGTLTCGSPELIDIRPAPGTDPRELLSMAASVESGSRHPIGTAIREHAAANGIPCTTGSELKVVAGGGVTGKVAGELVAVGSGRFLAGLGVSALSGDIEAASGAMVVCVARAGRYCGAIIMKDRVREDAPELISYFTRAGIGTLLLSGDRQESTGEAAAGLGIGAGIGELLPEEKASRIDALRLEGATVLMVGDGINDAPALSAADVGCAVAGGTDIAIETSDLVLVKPNLERLAFAHLMARRTMSVVRQNLAWAFLYNVIGIPLAMTGRLTPIYAAAAMALSSLCVVGNSLRLLGGRRG